MTRLSIEGKELRGTRTIPISSIELFAVDWASAGPSDCEFPVDLLLIVYRRGASTHRTRFPVLASHPESKAVLDELGRRLPHADLRGLPANVALRRMGMWSVEQRVNAVAAAAVGLLAVLIVAALVST